ncbi:hypothetical protein R6L23_28015 [Streptomyces sp. SR27]|uniref:hypothetical protein n=1 Tax=Streptomyces sp. SR27 TaxID=3076630 RepID=UPI00295A917A|nr:hypothetical protein [Streptomyces sp. SR27]MDV9192006.1 hypothetical protein [Streptomyces sp. SR27]
MLGDDAADAAEADHPDPGGEQPVLGRAGVRGEQAEVVDLPFVRLARELRTVRGRFARDPAQLAELGEERGGRTGAPGRAERLPCGPFAQPPQRLAQARPGPADAEQPGAEGQQRLVRGLVDGDGGQQTYGVQLPSRCCPMAIV